MRLLLLLLIGVFFAAELNAQHTLTTEYFPSIGSEFTFRRTSTQGFQIPDGVLTGNGYTWDYSSLPDTGSTLTIRYIDPASTPYTSNFPDANLALQIQKRDSLDHYTYFLSNSSGFITLGEVSEQQQVSAVITFYEPAVRLPDLPLEYMDSANGWTDLNGQFAGNTTMDYSYVYDGYGTLILPTGTFDQVVRLKTITNSKGYTIDQSAETTRYSWLSAQGGHELLVFTEQIVTGFSPSRGSSFLYNMDATPVALAHGSFDQNVMTVFPNPAVNNISLAGLPSGASIHVAIHNLSGQAVVSKTITTSNGVAGLDLAGIASGLYLVQAQSDGKLFTAKVQVR